MASFNFDTWCQGFRYKGSPTTPHSDGFRKIGAEHRAETRSRSGNEKVAKGRQGKTFAI